MKSISSAYLKQIIQEGHAFVKTISSHYQYNQAWETLIKQLADPKNNRGTKTLDNEIDRNWTYNPKLGEWKHRDYINKPRGGFKDTIFTKKTPVSLSPKDGIMHFFQSADPRYRASIAIIFDLRKCDLKDEKYVFPKDMNMHTKWWRKIKNMDFKDHVVHQGIYLQQLAIELEEQRSKGIIPKHNDISAGLSSESIVGLLILENTLENRLNAIRNKQLIRKNLNIDIPIFIQDLHHQSIHEYSLEQQKDDFDLAMSFSHNEASHIIATQYLEEIPLAIKTLITNNNNTTDNIEKLFPENFLSMESINIGNNRILTNHLNYLIKITNPDYRTTNTLKLSEHHEIINFHRKHILSFITQGMNVVNSFDIIYQFVCHLYYHRSSILAEACAILLHKKDPRLMPVLEIVMQACRNATISSEKVMIGYHYTQGWMYRSQQQNEVYVKDFSSLVSGMLNYDANRMAAMIANFFPQHLNRVLSCLTHIYDANITLMQLNGVTYFSLEKIEECQLALLQEKEKRSLNDPFIKENETVVNSLETTVKLLAQLPQAATTNNNNVIHESNHNTSTDLSDTILTIINFRSKKIENTSWQDAYKKLLGLFEFIKDIRQKIITQDISDDQKYHQIKIMSNLFCHQIYDISQEIFPTLRNGSILYNFMMRAIYLILKNTSPEEITLKTRVEKRGYAEEKMRKLQDSKENSIFDFYKMFPLEYQKYFTATESLNITMTPTGEEETLFYNIGWQH